MPRALVVYESMFGNTEAVAESIVEGLATSMTVSLREVGHAPYAVGDDVDLLVVGGPTHAFGLSRQTTRKDAAAKAAGVVVSGGPGLREWLDRADVPLGIQAATFATRAAHPRLPGSAARAAARRLRHAGADLASSPEDFWVTGMTGPLATGELERARRWAESLAATVAGRLEPVGQA
jgi:flavorubredoxin